MNTMENLFFDFMAMTFEPPKLAMRGLVLRQSKMMPARMKHCKQAVSNNNDAKFECISDKNNVHTICTAILTSWQNENKTTRICLLGA
jgi:hypothetical protein